MISGTKRACHGASRDRYGDDVVGCRRGRRQRGKQEPTPQQRRKSRGTAAADAARRRGVRLLYVAGVAGIGLLFLQVTSSPPAYWIDAPTALAQSSRAKGEKKTGAITIIASSTEGVAAADLGSRHDDKGRPRGPEAAVGDGRGEWRRRLATSSDGEQDQDLLEELTQEEEDEEAAATAATCAANNFSGGGAGKVVLLVIAILFTFNGLAIVCDEFFQASLEKISEVLGLTPDVAGATFLAAGSSAPELFTSIADVFGPSNSIGVGTIVGSAMFNVLVIVALSAAVAAKSGASGVIDHRVVARDVCFYTGSIFLLVTSVSDNKIEWWEALLMVSGYGLYIVFMIYNSRILAMCSTPRGTVLPTVGGMEMEALEAAGKPGENPGEEEATKPSNPGMGGDGAADGGAPTRRRSSARRGSADGGGVGGEGEEGAVRRGSQLHSRRVSRVLRVSHLQERRASQQGTRVSHDVAGEDPMAAAAAAAVVSVAKGSTARLSWEGQAVGGENAGGGGGGGVLVKAGEEGRSRSVVPMVASNAVSEGMEEAQNLAEDDEEDRLAWPKGWVQRFLFVFGLPFMVALSLTIPDCSRPKYEKYYILTFIMSITWISIISTYMVALATGAACILGVSAIVMGVLVLAVGTSVPDMIGSMIAAKNGEASMAIANAIGSNVFNILLGLGGPWLVSSLVSGEPTSVDSEGATTALIILFCAVLIFVGSLILSKWSMNTKLAYCLLGTYAAYVVYTITMEALKNK